MTRVLLAPAAQRFSSVAVSENGWMYDIVFGMVELDPELHVTCVAETGDPVANAQVEQHLIGPRRSDEIGGAVLPLRIAAAVRSIGVLDQVNLVHHGLPFALGRTYSLLAWQAAQRRLPLVVGPVQTPLSWTGPDEEAGLLGTHRQTLAQAVSHHVARAVWPVLSGATGHLSDATLRSARRVVTIDEQARRQVLTRGVLAERVQVIPPPLRMAAHDVSYRDPDDSVVRVVTAGYLIERKAVDQVVTAVAHLAAAGTSVVLDVVGEGPALPELRRLAGALPGGEVVRFRGWLQRNDLQRVLSSCHVYATMSRAESWGQGVVEAMALGLVAVSAANSGARSLVELDAPLHVVGVGDIAELEAVLGAWCGYGPAATMQAGAAGVHWARATVAVQVIARRWCEVYRQVIEEPIDAVPRFGGGRLMARRP
jgi:glycosyltransferase involved in cell wall biosynthesis